MQATLLLLQVLVHTHVLLLQDPQLTPVLIEQVSIFAHLSLTLLSASLLRSIS